MMASSACGLKRRLLLGRKPSSDGLASGRVPPKLVKPRVVAMAASEGPLSMEKSSSESLRLISFGSGCAILSGRAGLREL